MKKRKMILGFIVCVLICSFNLLACNNMVTDIDKQNNITTEIQTEDFSDVETEYYLENGYYTIGVDIPAGICEIYATSGTGNILYSADGTIETYSDFDDDLNQVLTVSSTEVEKIVDYPLKEGYVIHISGPVRAKVTYSEITSLCMTRNYDEDNKFILEPGIYTAGVNFESGIYTINAIDGNGYLTSSNAFELGVDELFGVFDGTEAYVPKTEHVTFKEGDILEVTDVTIEMLKVKDK